MIFLRDASEKTLAALKELGFEQTGECKAVTLLIGSIDVRKLDKPVQIESLIRVRALAE